MALSTLYSSHPGLDERAGLSSSIQCHLPVGEAFMIKTHGLTHLALAVQDKERSFRFYETVFGVREVYRDKGQIQVQTPGCRDIIVFDETALGPGEKGGMSHFGFRLVDPGDIDAAATALERAGGHILERGEFLPGEPYVFAADPDGYTVEIWFE